MEQVVSARTQKLKTPNYQEAWEMVSGQLRSEMSRAQYETWVKPLQPIGYRDRVFKLGVSNSFGQNWVESRLQNKISGMLTGMFNEPVTLKLVINNGFMGEIQEPVRGRRKPPAQPALTEEPAAEPEPPARSRRKPADKKDDLLEGEGDEKSSPRKLMLQRAYGTERARVIQPERGMFVTLYFFNHWLPLIGHSAFTVILAARSMCYWNPKTGELRNSIDTDMAELAQKASVSVRTVKEVLNNDLVRQYFIRYTVRRMMTPNGVRTAGITLQVRMDDPLTPEDQETSGLEEEEYWYSPEFGGEED